MRSGRDCIQNNTQKTWFLKRLPDGLPMGGCYWGMSPRAAVFFKPIIQDFGRIRTELNTLILKLPNLQTETGQGTRKTEGAIRASVSDGLITAFLAAPPLDHGSCSVFAALRAAYTSGSKPCRFLTDRPRYTQNRGSYSGSD